MAWLFAAVVLVLAVLVPQFRKVLLIGGGVIAVGIFILFAAGQREGSGRTTTETPAISAPTPPPPPPKLIPVDEIAVRHVRSNLGVNGGSSISYVTARVFNNAETDTLYGLDFRMLIDDCEKRGGTSSCATVHDQTGSLQVTVPPKQARDVGINVSDYTGVSIIGTPRVRIEIKAARASDIWSPLTQ